MPDMNMWPRNARDDPYKQGCMVYSIAHVCMFSTCSLKNEAMNFIWEHQTPVVPDHPKRLS